MIQQFRNARKLARYLSPARRHPSLAQAGVVESCADGPDSDEIDNRIPRLSLDNSWQKCDYWRDNRCQLIAGFRVGVHTSGTDRVRRGLGRRLGVFAGLVIAGAGAGLIAGTATVTSTWPRTGYGTAGGIAGLAGAIITDRVTRRREDEKAARRLRAAVLEDVTTELPESGSVFGYLLATNTVAPFRGRQADRTWLKRWCDDAEGCPVAIVAGPAGVGKSRLAVQFATERPEPWVTGWLRPGRGAGAVAAVRACGDPALILVDDAGERADVADLVASLSDSAHGESLVRVLLITRAEGLKGRLERALPDRPRLILANAEQLLIGAFGASDDYARWFSEAVRAYAKAVGTPPPDLSAVVSGWSFDASEPILTLQAQALLTVLESQRKRPAYQGSRVPPFDEVAEALFRHEEHRWDSAAKTAEAGLTDFAAPDQLAALAALLIARPADLASAAAALAGLPEYGDAPERVRKIARWAASLYPAQPPWPIQIKPDLLAEWFLVSQITQNLDLARLASTLTTDQVMPLLMLIAEASDHLPQAVPIFADLIAADLINRAEVGITAALRATTRRRFLDARLAEQIMSAAWPTSVLDAMDAALTDRLPRTRVAVASARVRNARAADDAPALASSLNNLGLSLRGLGKYQGALAAWEEALAIRRPLAADNPAHLPDLAASLTNLGGSLRALGRPQEALAVWEEALVILRALAADNPAHLSDLAASLSNLGLSLNALGRPQEALAADEEALVILRALAADNPAHLPDLATSLTNVDVSLNALGRPQEALAADEEALVILRALAADNPADRPDLATSLSNLGASLSDLGRHQEAFAAWEEALVIRRALAADNPAHRPGLATSLSNLGASLHDVGRPQEALAADQEALAIFRALAADNPAHRPDLATSLSNLGASLSDLGRPQEALAAWEEALVILRALAADNPAHRPGLATSLSNLGASLHDAGAAPGSPRRRPGSPGHLPRAR